MKVLFDHPSPFLLAHGGFQIQIEQTKKALEAVGVEVDWLRWWDVEQKGDIIHYFGRPHAGYIKFANQKGMKVVMSELLTGPGSRPASVRKIQKCLMWGARTFLPRDFTAKMAWDSYHLTDAAIALTPWEKQLMVEMFDADPTKVEVVPNGVEEIFLQRNDEDAGKIEKSKWLVCTATITERKRVMKLAQAAILAETPLWVIGKPYSESDPYYKRFLEVVKGSSGMVRYEGPISDRSRLAEIYRTSRGSVLLSTMESLSLSALEAAAGGCPLLLSDLPWARCTFGEVATYCPVAPPEDCAPIVKNFYELSATLPVPSRPLGWREVALQLQGIYRSVMNFSGRPVTVGGPVN